MLAWCNSGELSPPMIVYGRTLHALSDTAASKGMSSKLAGGTGQDRAGLGGCSHGNVLLWDG